MTWEDGNVWSQSRWAARNFGLWDDGVALKSLPPDWNTFTVNLDWSDARILTEPAKPYRLIFPFEATRQPPRKSTLLAFAMVGSESLK